MRAIGSVKILVSLAARNVTTPVWNPASGHIQVVVRVITNKTKDLPF